MYYSGAPFAFKENKNVRSLLAYISKKGFTMGDKLPPERELAEQLGISVPSVKTHLSALFNKLGAANRAEAIAIALRKHLLKI